MGVRRERLVPPPVPHRQGPVPDLQGRLNPGGPIGGLDGIPQYQRDSVSLQGKGLVRLL
jgi:hypothetical protein